MEDSEPLRPQTGGAADCFCRKFKFKRRRCSALERRRREGSHEMIPRREPRQQKSTKRTGHKVVFILGTVLLVGICTVAMLAGLFMMYVRTTLAPTLEVNADDYTMNLSSIIYYQDRDTGDWVEYQTVYGTENRIWVDYEQIPDALWQAAVALSLIHI